MQIQAASDHLGITFYAELQPYFDDIQCFEDPLDFLQIGTASMTNVHGAENVTAPTTIAGVVKIFSICGILLGKSASLKSGWYLQTQVNCRAYINLHDEKSRVFAKSMISGCFRIQFRFRGNFFQ